MTSQETRSENLLKPFVVNVSTAMRLGDWSRATLYDKINKGRLEAVKDGVRTKIILSSIKHELASLPRIIKRGGGDCIAEDAA